jgi:hypothetical protein
MKTINEVLTELSPNLLSEIRGYFCSINKIDTSSSIFHELLEKHPNLLNAVYIVNPNINNFNGSIFLGSKGEVVLHADFFANLLNKVELDFIIDNIPNLTKNHPLKEILTDNITF